MKRSGRSAVVVGSVHLYGASACGFGTLVRYAADGRVTGTGDPVPGRSATDAVWLALDELRRRLGRGLVEVHHDFPQGPKVATVALEQSWPYFGELEWRDAPVYVISAEALEAAAEKEA